MTVMLMAEHHPALTLGCVEVDEPGFVQQGAYAGPRLDRQQQVVAFGDDQPDLGADLDHLGQRVLDVADELRRVDRTRLVADPAQQLAVALGVERLRSAFDVGLAVAGPAPGVRCGRHPFRPRPPPPGGAGPARRGAVQPALTCPKPARPRSRGSPVRESRVASALAQSASQAVRPTRSGVARRQPYRLRLAGRAEYRASPVLREALSGEPFFVGVPCALSGSGHVIPGQSAEKLRESFRVAGRKEPAIHPGVKDAQQATSRAADHRPSPCERLHGDKAEAFGFVRWHEHHVRRLDITGDVGDFTLNVYAFGVPEIRYKLGHIDRHPR